VAKLRVRTKSTAPRRHSQFLRCRFTLHSVTPSPYEAQQEESRAEQR
jgi:hypothetical protein